MSLCSTEIDYNNNLRRCTELDPNPPSSIIELVRQIYKVIKCTRNKYGSSEKEIRKLLKFQGITFSTSKLRRAIIIGLRDGIIARPKWAVDDKVYGIYTTGSGKPYFAKKQAIDLVREICHVIKSLRNKRGVSEGEIRKYLKVEGNTVSPDKLRKALLFALKLGMVERPRWAEKAGVYGRYVLANTDCAGVNGASPRPCRPQHGYRRVRCVVV